MTNSIKAMNNGKTQYNELTIANFKVSFKIDTSANINVLPIKYINKNIEQEIEQKIVKLYALGGICKEAIAKHKL